MSDKLNGSEEWFSDLEITHTLGFRVTVGTELDFENPVGDIIFNDEIVAIISQERGYNLFDVELWPRQDGSRWLLDLPEFLATVEITIARLRKLNGEVPP